MRNDFGEAPERLAPTSKTLQTLFIKSGNQCAYPGCNQPMHRNDNLIGQVCHIEDALPGGRWNKFRSNEENRREENLMLMCYEHHVETNDVEAYSVDSLKEMKESHEENIRDFKERGRSNVSTILDFSGSKNGSIIGCNFTGGAQVRGRNTENFEIINTDIDGGEN